LFPFSDGKTVFPLSFPLLFQLIRIYCFRIFPLSSFLLHPPILEPPFSPRPPNSFFFLKEISPFFFLPFSPPTNSEDRTLAFPLRLSSRASSPFSFPFTSFLLRRLEQSLVFFPLRHAGPSSFYVCSSDQSPLPLFFLLARNL